MDTYGQVAVAGEGNAHHFSDTLFELSVFVGIHPPTFQGKPQSWERDLEKWEIKTYIPGRTANPEDEGMEYAEEYPDWDYSIDVAMQGDIARICHKYHHRIPRTSAYFQFGERTEDGHPVDREGTDRWSLIHRYEIEREFSAAGMENLMRRQLAGIDALQGKLTDMVRRVVHAQDLAEHIDDQRLELEERIALLKDPLKMEEKMIQKDVWADILEKTLWLAIDSRTAETKENEKLKKEVEALKLENASLKETISELGNPRRKKHMTASQYCKQFKPAPGAP